MYYNYYNRSENNVVLSIQPATGCYSRSNELLNCRSNGLSTFKQDSKSLQFYYVPDKCFLCSKFKTSIIVKMYYVVSHYWAGSGERQLSELTGQKSELKQK
jgi:hypothetical protein